MDGVAGQMEIVGFHALEITSSGAPYLEETIGYHTSGIVA
jgi:hypothetical protein